MKRGQHSFFPERPAAVSQWCWCLSLGTVSTLTGSITMCVCLVLCEMVCWFWCWCASDQVGGMEYGVEIVEHHDRQTPSIGP